MLLFVIGCTNDGNYEERIEVDANIEYKLFRIDKCEYIWYKNYRHSGQTLTHKGNCDNHERNLVEIDIPGSYKYLKIIPDKE